MGIEDLQVRQQKAGSSASVATEAERALRDALNDVLTSAGIDVVTDVEEGQRVLDEANGKNRDAKTVFSSLPSIDVPIDEYAKIAHNIATYHAGETEKFVYTGNNFWPMGQNGCFSARKTPIRLPIGHFGC